MNNDNLLKVTTVQANLIWENKAANLEKFDQMLENIGETDVIVLPEMFTTGFSMTPKRLAENLFSETFDWMTRKSKIYNAAVVGSFICQEDDKFYNRLIWMQPDGNYHKYDKRHLFTLAGENAHYTEGSERLTIDWRGWRICPLICYDLRFPVWSRNVLQPNFGADKTNGRLLRCIDVCCQLAERRNHAWKILNASPSH